MPNLIRDIPETSGYWGAVWTVCNLPDIHVIADAPVGCYSLLASAVSNYTDAIPNLENITPSFIREAEVMGSGTWPAVENVYKGLHETGKLEGKQLIVVSTAESEMIGSDLSEFMGRLGYNAKFFHSESLTHDEWTGRDRALIWLWENYGGNSATTASEPGLVNIIGPTYGCFNAPADLHEIRRLVEGAGGRINVVFPYEATVADIARLPKAQVNVVMYKEFGHTLANALERPWLYAPMGLRATTDFIRQLAQMLGTTDQAERFIKREKATTLKPIWDMWKGPQGDWYSTTTVGIVATGTYVDGLRAFLGDEMGMPVTLTAARPLRPGDMDNIALRKAIHAGAPSFLFGSINEKIYLSEAGNKMTNFIPAAFPGPIVRRALGTPFMGYAGTVYVVQEIVNRLFETLFNVLPLDTAYGRPAGGPPVAAKPSLPWQPAAKAQLDAALSKLHFLTRISVSQELQMAAETYAHTQHLSEVTPEVVEAVLAGRQGERR